MHTQGYRAFTNFSLRMSGRGSGRGAYYKEKYGGGRGGRGGHHGRGGGMSGSSSRESALNAVRPANGSLRDILLQMDGAQYGQLKTLLGQCFSLSASGILLFLDHVQSDPFAPPSRLRVHVPIEVSGFPTSLYSNRIRKVALQDFLTRCFAEYISSNALNVSNAAAIGGGGGWHAKKGADFGIDTPGQQVVERTCMAVSEDFVEARFTLSLPAQGRSILGRQTATLLTDTVLEIVHATLVHSALDTDKILHFVNCVEDQETLRNIITQQRLIAFVKDGAILPRASGALDLPMSGSNVVSFKSPDSLTRTFQLPHSGMVTGMAIPRGITLIVGGGFHGKSTLLDALQFGIYNHIPGDGREFCVVDSGVVKTRAEDGRSIVGVDVTPFLSNLPGGKNCNAFGTTDASGSTSMAAGIQEALEIGCTGFLFDEDTCATNFLIRDQRMQMLISHENEPITPLIARIRAIFQERGVSTILVIGGCGSYLDIADLVISLDSYTVRDITAKAKEVTKLLPEPTIDTSKSYPTPAPRVFRLPIGPSAETASTAQQHAARGGGTKSSARRTHLITFSGIDVDLAALEQLVHPSQSRLILDSLLYVRDVVCAGGREVSVAAAVQAVERVWLETGLGGVVRNGSAVGDYAGVRKLDLGAALNRVRGLLVKL
ncbi:hypothetical protein BC830DRAFT_1098921 [Chytriomyces sp. MP71]|nr:hypothetical protein BC830DRAFT_1098921 [Chytriomyces sp. MP71]